MAPDLNVVALAMLVAWLVGCWLLWQIRTCGDLDQRYLSDPGPLVSVIVPARNEERSLSNLLDSLAAQVRKADEVVVVDDNSTDATVSVATSRGARVIQAGALPAGWLGKARACWVGARASCGQILVFLDADTTLARDGLVKLLSEHWRAGGLLSVQPYHTTLKPYERLAAGLNISLMMGMGVFTPLGVNAGRQVGHWPG